MKLFLDCLPCMVRQALDASRMATGREDVHEAVMADAIRILSDFERYRNAPEICRVIHRSVKAHTGSPDPYRAVKDEAIRSALAVYPLVGQALQGRDDPLYWSLKAAAVGNTMDAALYGNVAVDPRVIHELDRPFAVCDIEPFRDRLRNARTLLLLGDNAGETVFDRFLLQSLPDLQVSYAVRSAPIINDATLGDALASGLGECAAVLSTGCDAPGVILDECSAEFQALYRDADIVVSKGQGNYETLSDASREIFFLLKAKCPMIARSLGVGLNEYVFRRSCPGTECP